MVFLCMSMLPMICLGDAPPKIPKIWQLDVDDAQVIQRFQSSKMFQVQPQIGYAESKQRLIWGPCEQRLETHFNRPPKILILVATPLLTDRVD